MTDLSTLLAVDSDVAETKDVVGGGGYVKPSGVYLVKINHAFFEESKGGATGVNISLKHSDEKKTEMNSTVYVTSGTAKGKKNYYIDKKGTKNLLPGYITMDEICICATGKRLAELPTVTKAVDVYDFSAGKKVSKQVQVIDELSGAILYLAISNNLVNKYSNGAPTAETQERNEISKAFTKDTKQTAKEKSTNAPAEFVAEWLKKNENITRDQRTIKDGATSAHAAPATPTVSADNTDGLFD